jgi:hypothetical protein
MGGYSAQVARMSSEHAVVVCRLFGDDREHVPMLHDLPVIESEDIDPGIVVVTGPVLEAVHTMSPSAIARLNPARFPGYLVAMRSK